MTMACMSESSEECAHLWLYQKSHLKSVHTSGCASSHLKSVHASGCTSESPEECAYLWLCVESGRYSSETVARPAWRQGTK